MNENEELYQIPENPTLQDLEYGIAISTNKIAILAEKQAACKNAVNMAEDHYKATRAIKYMEALSQFPKAAQGKLAAIVDSNKEVIEARKILTDAKGLNYMADAEFGAWDTVHISLRKLVNMKIAEMKTVDQE